jgi:fructosamine-3-kinase
MTSNDFVKRIAGVPADFYQREAEGLAWLAASGAVRTPRVIDVSSSGLILERINPGPRVRDFDERFGRQLAALHKSGAEAFGFPTHNYVGTLLQSNTPHATWAELYQRERLAPLIERAAHHFDSKARSLLDAVVDKVPCLVGPEEPPARLHGDLWNGNLLVTAEGEPCLIDPAVYGGHREIDLAMMRLFGGFGRRVFEAYDEAYPLAADYASRVPLYQLYPLLVHVNLFGSGYVAQTLDCASRL